jgi:hypothetical protein
MSTNLFQNPKFDALRSAIYHAGRTAHYTRLCKLLDFGVIILSASVVVKAAGSGSIREAWLDLGVVVLATAQLVFDFGNRACEHGSLMRRYYDVLSEMEGEDLSVPAVAAKWSAKLARLCAEETVQMRAVAALAFNHALDALCTDEAERRRYWQHTRWWHRLLRHVMWFDSVDFGSPASLTLRRGTPLPPASVAKLIAGAGTAKK